MSQPPIKLQILSDIHLEAPKAYDIFSITPSAPYLALLGDIGCVKDDDYFTFLTAQLAQFKIVFLLLGNHEPYHSSWNASRERIRAFERDINTNPPSGRGRFVFLDRERFDLSETVTILGCVLFSQVEKKQEEAVSFGLNDFYHIEEWTVEQHSAVHRKDLEWLNEQVVKIEMREPERKIMIFTHHSPTVMQEAVDPKNVGSNISSGFATDLSGERCWMSKNVKVWAFGHTHWNCDFVDEGGKRVLTNQRGYYFSQALGFEAGKCIELEQ